MKYDPILFIYANVTYCFLVLMSINNDYITFITREGFKRTQKLMKHSHK